MRSLTVCFLLLLAAALLASGCKNSVSQNSSISIKVTQPAENQVIKDTVVRIITDVNTSCTCKTHVEFYINDTLRYSDYIPYYSWDWNIRGLSGKYVIAARAVVDGEAQAWDSVHVTINQ